ncbi:MAG: AsmA family protein [Rhodospirillaceae bacterium]|nr:AsmA family protein [Rhodospirillaceae bacterium]
MRRIIQVAVGVVVLLAVVVYGVLASIDVDSYRGTIIKAAEDATGRKVTISGPLKLKVSMSPAVVVEGVRLSNAPWAKTPEMLSIGRAEAEIGLFAALTGNIQVNRLVVHDTVVHLTRRKDGSANWEFSPTEKAKVPESTAPSPTSVDAGGSMPKIAVREIDIRNLTLALDDAVSGQILAVKVNTLTASAADFSDPVKLTLDMVYNGLEVAAKGSFGPIENVTQNQPATVDLVVTLPGVVASAKGRIGKPMSGQDINLKITFDGKSYDRIGQAMGADLAAVPPVALEGTLKTVGKGYRLENGTLKLGGQDIQIVVAGVDLSASRPKVVAEISADVLDIPKLLEGLTAKPAVDGGTAAPSQSAKAGDGRVFSPDPLPLDGLFLVDADAKLRVAALTLPGGLKLSQVAVTSTLKDGLFNLAPEASIGGGVLGGKITLDARPEGGPASLNVALSGTDITLGQVASDMGLTSVMSGAPTALQVTLKGTGKSVRQLMAGLTGDVNVETGKGEIINAELRKAIGDWAMSGLTMVDSGFATRQKTVLSCLVVRVPVKQGMIALGRGVAAETNALNVVVGGSIDLRSEALSLGVDPTPQEANVGITQMTAGLVRITGTLGAPSVGVDALGAGKAALKVGAAVATGGLSLLGNALIGEVTNDPHPCQTAKGLTSSKSNGTTTKSSSSPPSRPDPAKALDGAMKGLFGK